MGRSHRKSATIRRKRPDFNINKLTKDMNQMNPETPRNLPTPTNVEITNLKSRVNRLEADLQAVIRGLGSRLDSLEKKINPPPPGMDEMTAKILEFLKLHPNLKFNTGTICGNLGTNSMKISDKLKNLAVKGRIKMEKKEGVSTMYWYDNSVDREDEIDGPGHNVVRDDF